MILYIIDSGKLSVENAAAAANYQTIAAIVIVLLIIFIKLVSKQAVTRVTKP